MLHAIDTEHNEIMIYYSLNNVSELIGLITALEAIIPGTRNVWTYPVLNYTQQHGSFCFYCDIFTVVYTKYFIDGNADFNFMVNSNPLRGEMAPNYWEQKRQEEIYPC